MWTVWRWQQDHQIANVLILKPLLDAGWPSELSRSCLLILQGSARNIQPTGRKLKSLPQALHPKDLSMSCLRDPNSPWCHWQSTSVETLVLSKWHFLCLRLQCLALSLKILRLSNLQFLSEHTICSLMNVLVSIFHLRVIFQQLCSAAVKLSETASFKVQHL